MEDLIPRLRAFGTPNQPCTPEQLHTLAAELGCEIDADLMAIYGDHDGTTDTWGEDDAKIAFRLVPVAEVVDMYHTLREGKFEFPTSDWRVFWTDDQSNYAAVYVEGPLRGKVCFVAHDSVEENYIPYFRTVRSFCAELVRVAALEGRWSKLSMDYPACASVSPADEESDRGLALQYAAECRMADEDERQEYLAGCVIQLIPYADGGLLLSLSQDENEHLRQRAGGLIQQRQREERATSALPRLVELIRTGPHGRRSEARQEISRLFFEVDRESLRRLGVEVRTVRKGIEYRASPDSAWERLER
ncbi:MAG TPA: SMI1/KNR4 family protein [Longimicrobium sp.]